MVLSQIEMLAKTFHISERIQFVVCIRLDGGPQQGGRTLTGMMYERESNQ